MGVSRVSRPRRRAGGHRSSGARHRGRRDLRGMRGAAVRHQCSLSPGELAPAQCPALDAPIGPLGHLPPDRRLLHALRPARPRRDAGGCDSGGGVGRGARRHRAQAGVDRRSELAGGPHLRAARLGGGRGGSRVGLGRGNHRVVDGRPRRSALHRGRGRLRPPPPGPGAHRVRLPRGVPPPGDRSRCAAVRGGRVLGASRAPSAQAPAYGSPTAEPQRGGHSGVV